MKVNSNNHSTKQVVYLIGLLLLFTQCKHQKVENTYSKPIFQTSVNRQFQKIDNGFLFGPGALQMMDSFLIIECKTNINDNSIHVFNKISGKYITSFGTIGSGPGELSDPVSRVTIDAKKRNIYICDLSKNKLVTFNLDKIINNKNNFYEETELYPELKNNVAFFSITNNNFLAAYTAFENNSHRFVKGNLNDTISTYNQYIRLSEPEGYEHVEKSYFSYKSSIAVNPEGTKFVSATKSGLILETFDISGNKIKPIAVKRFYEPVYEVSNRESKYPFIIKNKNAVEGTMGLRATNKYIYNLLNETSDPNIRNEIAVFDWEGNPVKKYVLDCNILSLSVDEKENKAYILSFNEEDLNFGYFDL